MIKKLLVACVTMTSLSFPAHSADLRVCDAVANDMRYRGEFISDHYAYLPIKKKTMTWAAIEKYLIDNYGGCRKYGYVIEQGQFFSPEEYAQIMGEIESDCAEHGC